MDPCLATFPALEPALSYTVRREIKMEPQTTQPPTTKPPTSKPQPTNVRVSLDAESSPRTLPNALTETAHLVAEPHGKFDQQLAIKIEQRILNRS